MIVYFFIDELNRDSITANLLESRLQKKKHSIVFGNRTSIHFLKYFHSYFDVIIIPRIDFLTQHFGDSWLLWKSKIVTLSNESIGIIAENTPLCAKTALEKDFFEGKEKYTNRIDLFALWGNMQFNSIKKFAPKYKKKLLVIGHPRYDSFKLEKYKRFNKKKVIGIITRFNAINDYYGRSIIDFFSLNFKPTKYEYFNPVKKKGLLYKRNQIDNAVVQQTIDLKNILQIISGLNKKNFRIIIRAHPKEKKFQIEKIVNKISKNIFIHNDQLPIQDFLGKIDYLIGPPSTVFYESIFFKLKPISICSLEKKRRFFVPELGEDNNKLMNYVYKPKSIKELLGLIEKKISFKMNKKINNILKNELNYPDCINSLDKLVSKFEEMNSSRNNRIFILFTYRFCCEIYFFLWKLRNFFIKRKMHSAYFPLNFKILNFIKNLNK